MPVDELEKGGSFPWTIDELLVERLTHGFRAGPSFFVGDDDTPVEKRVL